MAGAPIALLMAHADSARAVASLYTASLVATLPLAIAALAALVLRGASAEARALVWRSAVVTLLVVFVGRQVPVHWIAWIVPSLLAAPLVVLGRVQVTNGSAPVGVGAPDMLGSAAMPFAPVAVTVVLMV